jgi:hypothetical protein
MLALGRRRETLKKHRAAGVRPCGLRHSHKGTLGWLSWIAARLGRWNCYYKKPGPKTMATGWRQLAAMIAGFIIAMPDLAVYGADV